MLMIKFRKEDDGKRLIKKVKKMREEIKEVEDILNECLEDDYDTDFRHDDDFMYDDRRMRMADRMNPEEYRRYRRMN